MIWEPNRATPPTRCPCTCVDSLHFSPPPPRLGYILKFLPSYHVASNDTYPLDCSHRHQSTAKDRHLPRSHSCLLFLLLQRLRRRKSHGGRASLIINWLQRKLAGRSDLRGKAPKREIPFPYEAWATGSFRAFALAGNKRRGYGSHQHQ